MRIPAFCICENKGADQLRSKHAADQRLCFGYIDSAIRNFKHLAIICGCTARFVWKPRRQVFSRCGSYRTKQLKVDTDQTATLKYSQIRVCIMFAILSIFHLFLSKQVDQLLHEKRNNFTPGKDSDQQRHPSSLII